MKVEFSDVGFGVIMGAWTGAEWGETNFSRPQILAPGAALNFRYENYPAGSFFVAAWTGFLE
jgi:hypothetical protein